MREFKFIRGKYTDENIFNSDETTECLFAYDKEGKLVQFTVKNNKEFQNKFAELSSDRLSEIYTLRPSQFTVSAKQVGNAYSFDFKANENVYDGSRAFPEEVISNAQSYLKSETTALIGTDGIPKLNLEGDSETKTSVRFTFNDKTFTRNLIFKVSGLLKERGYTTASGENIDAYPTIDGKINYSDTPTTGTFYNGLLQTEVSPTQKAVVTTELTVNYNDSISTLGVASKYRAGEDTAFIYGGQLTNVINYAERISFDLYQRVSQYLTPATASNAVTTNVEFTNNGVTRYILGSNNIFTVSNDATPVTDTTYYEVNDSGEYYASVENGAPHTILNTENVTFVNGITEPLSVSALLEKARNNVDIEIIISDNTGVTGRGYVQLESGEWTEAGSGDVSAEYKHNRKRIDGLTFRDGSYNIRQGDTTIEGVSTDEISVELTWNGQTVLAYKVFDTSGATKYFVTSEVEHYLDDNSRELEDFVRLTTSLIATTYTLNNGFVAYSKNTELTNVFVNNVTTAYAVANNNVNNIDNPENYDFYTLVSGENVAAYIKKNTLTTPELQNNTIIKGYSSSYSELFILDNASLRSLTDDDLTGISSIDVYTSNSYHLINGNVYDDSTNTTRYVMWSDDEWLEDVNVKNENASVNGDNIVSPIITNDTMRLITSIDVNATQSD